MAAPTNQQEGRFKLEETKIFAKFIVENEREFASLADFCRAAENIVTTRNADQLRKKYANILRHSKVNLDLDEKLLIANEHKPDLSSTWMKKYNVVKKAGKYETTKTADDVVRTEQKPVEKRAGTSSQIALETEEEEELPVNIKKEDPDAVSSKDIDKCLKGAWKELEKLIIEKISEKFVSEERVRQIIQEEQRKN